MEGPILECYTDDVLKELTAAIADPPEVCSNTCSDNPPTQDRTKPGKGVKRDMSEDMPTICDPHLSARDWAERTWNDMLKSVHTDIQPPPAAERLPVWSADLCWRCGRTGHQRQKCKRPRILFCSRCGRTGRMSRSCRCSPTPRRGQQLQQPKKMVDRAIQCNLISAGKL